MDDRANEDQLTLRLLQAIDEHGDLTQRGLSRRLGVALGLTNSYIKRCINRGLIKIQHAPANRYLYYLTPKGFAEKSKLTARYLSRSFDFYRLAGADCKQEFEKCVENGWRDIVLCGVSDLAEIAYVRAQEFPVRVLAVFDEDCGSKSFLGVAVVSKLDELPATHAFVVTAVKDPVAMSDLIAARVGKERVLVPSLLRRAFAPAS